MKFRKKLIRGALCGAYAGNAGFCKLAEAFGIESRRIDDEAVMDEAISRMLSFDGPFLLECVVDSDESTMLQ